MNQYLITAIQRDFLVSCPSKKYAKTLTKLIEYLYGWNGHKIILPDTDIYIDEVRCQIENVAPYTAVLPTGDRLSCEKHDIRIVKKSGIFYKGKAIPACFILGQFIAHRIDRKKRVLNVDGNPMSLIFI